MLELLCKKYLPLHSDQRDSDSYRHWTTRQAGLNHACLGTNSLWIPQHWFHQRSLCISPSCMQTTVSLSRTSPPLPTNCGNLHFPGSPASVCYSLISLSAGVCKCHKLQWWASNKHKCRTETRENILLLECLSLVFMLKKFKKQTNQTNKPPIPPKINLPS